MMNTGEGIRKYNDNIHVINELNSIKKDAVRACISYTSEEIIKWLEYIDENEKPFEEQNIFIHKNGDEKVAFITISIDENQNIGKIENLFVVGKYHGEGYGTKLLEKAEKELSKQVHTIQVRSTLNAKDFYEKHGYEHKEYSTSRVGFRISLMEKSV